MIRRMGIKEMHRAAQESLRSLTESKFDLRTSRYIRNVTKIKSENVSPNDLSYVGGLERFNLSYTTLCKPSARFEAFIMSPSLGEKKFISPQDFEPSADMTGK
jgi:hypothetical protein